MAITEACKEAIWLRVLLREICGDLQTTTIFCDSQSAIFPMTDETFHERMKRFCSWGHCSK